MKFKLIFVAFWCGIIFSYAQATVYKPDFFKIQTEVKNPNGKFYLPKLLERYNKKDVTLSLAELHHLYYGYRMVNKYNPVTKNEKDAKLQAIKAKRKNYNEAIELCDKMLEADIFDLDFLKLKNIYEFELKKDNKISDECFKFYYNTYMAIKSSGMGLKQHSPIYVINENHINFILYLMGLEATGISNTNGNIKYVEIKENYLSQKGIYFDITLTQQQTFTEPQKLITQNKPKDIANTEKEKNIENQTTNVLEEEINIATIDETETETETPSNLDIQDNTSSKLNSGTDVVEDKLAERKRKLEEAKLAREKLIEERKLAREQLLAEKQLIRERLLAERKKILEENNSDYK